MNRHRLLICGVLGGLAWVCLGPGFAQGAGVYPTNPGTLMLDTSGTVTVSVYQLDDKAKLPSAVTPSSPSQCTTTGTGYYKDVTDCWLPEWDPVTNKGKSVFVVVNGSTSPPALWVDPNVKPTFPFDPTKTNPFVAALTTSAYPGNCTNVGTDTGPDFTLSPSSTKLPISATASVDGYELTPNDCGGMAVIHVGTSSPFILPKDGTTTVPANGIPDVWENLYGGKLDPTGDGDTGPQANTAVGDGSSNFDEYRGFIVSKKQVRTDPLHKDLFVYLAAGSSSLLVSANGPGTHPALATPAATLTLPGAAGTAGAVGTYTASAAVFSSANTLGEIVGTGGLRARITAVLNSTNVTAETIQAFIGTSLSSGSWQLRESIFGGVFAMYTPERVHVLGYGSPPDYPPVAPATYSHTKEWVDNFDNYSALGGIKYTTAGSALDRVINTNRVYGSAQKGIRVIESLATNVSYYGYTPGGTGSPDALGNVEIFSQKIVNNITTLISNGGARQVRYSPMTSKSTDWTPMTVVGNSTDPAVNNFIISRALQFYVGHELGHDFNLNTKGTSPPHFTAGTGDELDAAITTKVDSKTSGYNTFYIPSLYGASDQTVLLLK